MKTLDSSFTNALVAESSAIHKCWQITRLDGQVLGFTSFDLPLVIDGLTYEAKAGFDPTAIDFREGVETSDNQRISSYFDSDSITVEDLLAGKYNRARILAFEVNVFDLPSSLSLDPPKHRHLYTGIFGEIKNGDRSFEIEVRGLDYLLKNNLGNQTSKLCRYQFGDSNCGVNLANYTYSQNIINTINKYRFIIDGNFEDKFFQYGKIVFTSGANLAIIADIQNSTSNGEIILFRSLRVSPNIGDTAIVTAGCQKTLLACAIFNNVESFGGEPHVPLIDRYLNTPIS